MNALKKLIKNKYLTLKEYEHLWSKFKYLIRSITKNSDEYEEKYLKIKFNSNDDLPLNKTK